MLVGLVQGDERSAAASALYLQVTQVSSSFSQWNELERKVVFKVGQ